MQFTHTKKNNVSRYAIENEAFWKKHQSNFSNSGISRVEYCQMEKISYGRFGYWLSKLSPASLQAAQSNEKQFIPKQSVLLPVQAKPEPKSLNILCSMTLKNGLTLKIHDPSILSWILKEVV